MKNLNTIWFFRSNAICLNNDGGFGCKCLAGFDSFQKYIGCSDVDECSNGKYTFSTDDKERKYRAYICYWPKTYKCYRHAHFYEPKTC